jgi:hypothetical protein
MLDESSLELDFFLWIDLSFFLGVLAPLVSLWVWTLHSFFFWVLDLISRCFFFLEVRSVTAFWFVFSLAIASRESLSLNWQ